MTSQLIPPFNWCSGFLRPIHRGRPRRRELIPSRQRGMGAQDVPPYLIDLLHSRALQPDTAYGIMYSTALRNILAPSSYRSYMPAVSRVLAARGFASTAQEDQPRSGQHIRAGPAVVDQRGADREFARSSWPRQDRRGGSGRNRGQDVAAGDRRLGNDRDTASRNPVGVLDHAGDTGWSSCRRSARFPRKSGGSRSATVSLMSPVVSGMVLPVLKPRRDFLVR